MASAAFPLTTVAVLDAPSRSCAGAEPAEIRRATIADAPAIHALINANLAAGHLLPRTRGGRDAPRHALPGRHGARRASSAAPSWRRSAAPSPRSARWSSTKACRGRGFGSRIVEELNRWAVQEGFSTLCAFTHNAAPLRPPRVLDRAAPVAAGEDRHRLRRLPEVPAVHAVRDGAAAARPLAADVAGRPAAVPGDARDRASPIVPHQGRTIGADGLHGA